VKVVLLENVKGLGKKHEVVNASEGYARNYLFPRKLAKEANNQSLSEVAGKKSSIDFKKSTQIAEAEDIKQKLEQAELGFKLKAKNGKFFGSVTSKEISEQLRTTLGIEVDKKKIELEDAVKTPGIYTAKVKLYEGIYAKLKIKVEEEN